MKNTQQWLEEIKADPAKFNHWLERRYVGECLAADRIEKLAEFQAETRFGKVLNKIAKLLMELQMLWLCSGRLTLADNVHSENSRGRNDLGERRLRS